MASYRSQLVLGRKPWRRNREPAWIMESRKQRRNSHHSWGSTTSSLLETALLACRRVHTRKRKSIYKLQRWENCSNGTLGRWDTPVRVLSHSLQSVSPVDVTMGRTRQWGRGLAPPALSAHLLFFTSTLFFLLFFIQAKDRGRISPGRWREILTTLHHAEQTAKADDLNQISYYQTVPKCVS